MVAKRQLHVIDDIPSSDSITSKPLLKPELPLLKGREKEGRSRVLTLGTVLRLVPRPLSRCTFIRSLSGRAREPAMEQMLLRHWGDGKVLAPLSSLVSTGWREVSE